MSDDSQITMDLGKDLLQEIDAALEVLKAREPQGEWTRERLLLITITQGLKQISRQHPRVNVEFRGNLKRLVPEDMKGEKITIEDISAGGIRFKSLEPNLFIKNEIVEVEFNLNDEHETLMNRKMMVTHLTGTHVRGEFCETDDPYHRVSGEAIEDYLVSKYQE